MGDRQAADGAARSLNADRALIALGKWNRYGLFIFGVCNAVWGLAAMQMMVSAFAADQPSFQCVRQSSPSAQFNDTCSFEGNSCGQNGTVLQFSTDIGQTVVSESSLGEWSTSAFMTGIMVGGITLPSAADRWGRKSVLTISVLLMGLMGLFCAMSPNYLIFAAARFVEGCFYAGSTMINWVLGCESVAPETRAFGTVLMGVFWTGGYCLLAPLAYWITNWRWLYIAISLPVLSAISLFWILPESLHWLVANGKVTEAEKWLKRAERQSGVLISLDQCLEKSMQESGQKYSKRTVADLFTTKLLFFYTAIMAYLWMCDTFVYYGLSLFSTKLAGNRYANFALSGFVELPAYFVAPVLLNRIGRKLVVGGSHFLAGASLLCLMIVPEDQQTASLGLWLFGKFSIACAFTCIFVYGAEIFPTTVRSTGIGVCGVISRVGGILAPHVRSLELVNELLPPLFFGLASLLGAFLTLFLPETLNRKLPEDVGDALHDRPKLSVVEWNRQKISLPQIT